MPIKSFVKANLYKDSVALMRISQLVVARAGIRRATLLMGTPANKQILAQVQALDATIAAAQPSDIMIAIEDDSDAAIEAAVREADALLEGEETRIKTTAEEAPPRSIAMALERAPNANLVQISVPGPYAAAEALKALHQGLNVFLFSDNVPVERERLLKEVAAKKDLLVMGPDCGTAIIGGVPLGFANVVRRGGIGLVGASGTGLQEVTCRIHLGGEGVSHAIGTGSHDISEAIGGATMRHGLALLAADPDTRVIAIVSKPPSPTVRDRVLAQARAVGKPVVVCFLGSPAGGAPPAPSIHPAATLQDAAEFAIALARGGKPRVAHAAPEAAALAEAAKLAPGQRHIRALFSGGTFCTEAQAIWREQGITAYSNAPLEREHSLRDPRASREHCAVDLGADEFTVGRPHPMIDYSVRTERLLTEASDPTVAALLLDVVLGYGSHEDPAGALAPAIRAAKAAAEREARHLPVICFVCGTEEDPQPLSEQQERLRLAGAILATSSTAAARLAGAIARGAASVGAGRPAVASRR